MFLVFQSTTCDYTQLDGMLRNVYTLLEKWKTQDTSPSLKKLSQLREEPLKQWDPDDTPSSCVSGISSAVYLKEHYPEMVNRFI